MESGVHGDLVVKMGRRSIAETTTPRNKQQPPTPSGESGFPRLGRLGSAGPTIAENQSSGSRTLWVVIALLVILLLATNTGMLISLVVGNGGDDSKDSSTASPGATPSSSSTPGPTFNPTQTSTQSGVPPEFYTAHLTATFDPYPPSDARGDATLDSGSQVWVTSQLGGGYSIHYYMKGLPMAESMGGFSVYTGATCSALEEELGQRSFVHSPVRTALWDKEVGETEVRGTVDVAALGFPLSQLERHAFVVQQENGKRIGCGILRYQHDAFDVDHLTTKFDAYPLSDAKGTATLGEESQVWLTARSDGGYMLHYFLTNLPENHESGGIHVHTGTSCASHAKVLGHYFSSEADPWTTTWRKERGARVAAGAVGVANPGFGLEMNAGHAFVVHEEGGKRIGCGVLRGVEVGAGRLREAIATLKGQNQALRAALLRAAPRIEEALGTAREGAPAGSSGPLGGGSRETRGFQPRGAPSDARRRAAGASFREGCAARSGVLNAAGTACFFVLTGMALSREGGTGPTGNLKAELLDWQAAEGGCKLSGGHLASVLSEEENRLVHELSRSVPESSAAEDGEAVGMWIGASDDAEVVYGAREGAFAWSGGLPVEYASWAAGQPDNGAGAAGGPEGCAALWRKEDGVEGWNLKDDACSKVKPAACAVRAEHDRLGTLAAASHFPVLYAEASARASSG